MQGTPRLTPRFDLLFHEDLVMAILQIPLIQGEHLSFNGEKNVHKVLVTCLRNCVVMITDPT